MRKAQKTQLQEDLKFLGQAHLEIKKQMEKGRNRSVCDLLEQCQQYAVRLGQRIEAVEGEGTSVVSLLEDYCELLYQIYLEIEQSGKSEKPEKCYKKLRIQQIRIENSIKNICVQREIVFLPYKASMWDSMESIWSAAYEDPDSTVYVIPVPYYDRNPDGSWRKLHNESHLYPSYVPVTDYGNYDFAERHPDMIFIHNPYDDCNYITSVHPFFYSQNLCRFTENLIYIPYFILDEPEPGDLNSEERIAAFCLSPGVRNANKVILQSEAMRQVYINILMKTIGAGYKRKELEKRILGLGSPKFDIWRDTGKANLEIPKVWLEKLCKPNGNYKKIILYNTGINGLLSHGVKELEKMRSVFQLLRENQKEITLLWRPHPLLKATLESMCPQLSKEYQDLEEGYRAEGWGIYDDTVQTRRALTLCDVYYGDGSSLIQLCRKAGKPVLLQNVEVTKYGGYDEYLDIPLIFENVLDDGKSFWFTEYHYNALFRMEKGLWEAKLVGVFPQEELQKARLYTSMTQCNGKLYFAPFTADEIAEYDPERDIFRKIPLKLPGKSNGRQWEYEKFFRVVSVRERMYFIPYHYPGILCYDTKTGDLNCFDDWVEEIENIREGSFGYFVEYEVYGDELLLPCACADAVVIFHVITNTARIVRTENTAYECKYCGICHEGSFFYLLSADGTLSKRLPDMEEIERVRLPVTEGSDFMEFYPIRSTNGWLSLFPYNRNRLYWIDTREKRMVWKEGPDSETTGEDCDFSFPGGITGDDVIYASSNRKKKLIQYHPDSGEKWEKKLLLSPTDRDVLEGYRMNEFIRRISQVNVMENKEGSLAFLVKALQPGSQGDDMTERKEAFGGRTTIGEEIYRRLISE